VQTPTNPCIALRNVSGLSCPTPIGSHRDDKYGQVPSTSGESFTHEIRRCIPGPAARPSDLASRRAALSIRPTACAYTGAPRRYRLLRALRRFESAVAVCDRGRSLKRRAILDDFRSCNADALNSYAGGLATQYAELKLAGLQEAPRHLAVFADPATDLGHGLGRRTMPEMTEYSVVAAIHTMWLAARAEGIGLGWVSILNPDYAKKVLDVPETWRLIGYFCVGYPQTEENSPELERAGWERRHDPEMFILRR
jgi:5,6-dimethylbenzimidazole synthase